MTAWSELAVPAAAAALGGLAATVFVLATKLRRQSRRVAASRAELGGALADVRALAARVDALVGELAGLGRLPEPAPEPAGATPPASQLGLQPVIVDAVEAGRPEWVPAAPVREALVRVLALAHGVQRALAPESRDRIRLAMRAEVRRSRRARRDELRTLRRHLRAQRTPAA